MPESVRARLRRIAALRLHGCNQAADLLLQARGVGDQGQDDKRFDGSGGLERVLQFARGELRRVEGVEKGFEAHGLCSGYALRGAAHE